MSKATPEELERLKNFQWDKSKWLDMPPHPMVLPYQQRIEELEKENERLRNALEFIQFSSGMVPSRLNGEEVSENIREAWHASFEQIRQEAAGALVQVKASNSASTANASSDE